MGFAILRTAKLSSGGNIGGLNAHLTRTMDVPNADPDLSVYNSRPIGSADLWGDVQRRIEESGAKVRKNAVLAVEHLITASPEVFGYKVRETKGKKELYGNVNAWKEFETSAQKWLFERYGRENVVNFTVHKDESTPHIHAVIVPIMDGKLNCRGYLGGREKMSEMQTSFAKAVEHVGLQRGIEGSKAKHMELKEFYGITEEAKKHIPSGYYVSSAYVPERLELQEPPLINRSNWKEKAENQINQEIKRQLELQRAHLEKQNQERLRDIKKAAQKSILRDYSSVLEKREAKTLQQKENTLKAKYEGRNAILEHMVKRMEQILKAVGLKYNSKDDTVEQLVEQDNKRSRGISR
jgi:hypothetical protein